MHLRVLAVAFVGLGASALAVAGCSGGNATPAGGPAAQNPALVVRTDFPLPSPRPSPTAPTPSPSAPPYPITMYTVPGASAIINLAKGPDGNIWFTELSGKVGKITTSGIATQYDVPNAYFNWGITAGSDGALWFTGPTNAIGRVTVGGTVSEFPVPDPATWDITTGADGNLWFPGTTTIEKMTTHGAVTSYPLPSPYPYLYGIAQGMSAIWYDDYGYDEAFGSVGSVTPSGTVTELKLTGSLGLNHPNGMTLGPDGNIWFCVQNSGIAKVTSGFLAFYYTPTSQSFPWEITAGPDGNLWFTENFVFKVGRITPSGVITEFPLPLASPPGYGPVGIVTGPDGNVWFADGDQIGKIVLQGGAFGRR